MFTGFRYYLLSTEQMRINNARKKCVTQKFFNTPRGFVTMDNKTEFVLKVMRTINHYDLFDQVMWHFGSEDEDCFPTFFVVCNDTFSYACADAEEITEENLELLIESCEDVLKVDEISYFGPYLFAAIVRNQMPLDGFFPSIYQGVKELFEKRLVLN